MVIGHVVRKSRIWDIPRIVRSFVLSRNGVVGVVPSSGSFTPGLIAAASALPVVPERYHPYISRDGGRLGLALAKPRRESDQLDISWLVVRTETGVRVNGEVSQPDDETRVVSNLVEAVCRDAVETGMVSVLAQVPEECAHLEVFRNLGFMVVVRERTYLRRSTTVPEPFELPGLRSQEKPDAWSVQQLYRACTPAAVQTAENLTSRTWGPPRRRFAGLGGEPASDSFVIEDKNEIIAWLRIDRASDGPNRFALMAQPGSRDVVPIVVDFVLDWLGNYPPGPVLTTVRDYEHGTIATLEESGFEEIYARILMVRNLGIRFKTRVEAPSLGRVPN